MNKVVELFGKAADAPGIDWQNEIEDQQCPFLGKRCYKVRKSNPEISIGSCTVLYGHEPEPIIICPTRLIQRGQIFTDCLHLLTSHEPGNELHLLSEVTVPGGSIDYVLVSAKDGKVADQPHWTDCHLWRERRRQVRLFKGAQKGVSSPRPGGAHPARCSKAAEQASDAKSRVRCHGQRGGSHHALARWTGGAFGALRDRHLRLALRQGLLRQPRRLRLRALCGW